MKSKWNTQDVYSKYAKKLLAQNPTWWGKNDQKITNFRIYSNQNGKIKEMMSYTRFKAIIANYFKGAAQYIIDGRSLRLGHSLGRIAGNRVERNHGTKTVDWGKTMEMWKKKGERKGLVYFIDDDWARIGWRKGKVKNIAFYRFTPAEGNKKEDNEGFQKMFSRANKQNKLLKYRYTYFPFIR